MVATSHDAGEPAGLAEEEILHVIVGHGLPELFTNTLRSFRAVCPKGRLLVIDNASPQASLRQALEAWGGADPLTEVVLRERNELSNAKVGALYQAYRLAFATASEQGFRYVHLLQGDMQLMWWDDDARAKIAELYRRHPRCVNVHTRAFSTDRTLMGDLAVDEASGDAVIPAYGMTDTGMVHLERWARFGMEFSASEEETAADALARGLEVVVSPWPTEIPVPWPAVVRRGRQVGREVHTKMPYLCRPLEADQVDAIKTATYPVSWENICVPWGWACLAPMSETDVSKWYYLNYRRHDLTANGWRRGRPRLVTEGLRRRLDLLVAPHRPSLAALILRPLPSLARTLAERVRRRTPAPS